MASTGTIVVTGAAGFIGSAVARALVGRGERVVGIDNFDPFYSRAVKERNAAEVGAASAQCTIHSSQFTSGKAGGNWELVEADLTDAAAVRGVFERVRPAGVIHLAGKAGVRPSLADPAGYMRANVVATQVVLSAAAAAGCERMVMASSSSVYGNASRVPFSESDTAVEPISPYAASKRACELLAHTHHHLTKMPTGCLRFFTVYGPRQRPDLAISLFMGKIARGEPIQMFGDGLMSRDFTYIDDIVAGVLAAYERVDRFGCRVWNLGNSSPVRLDEMIAVISRVVGKEAKVEQKPMQAGDVERTFADLTRSSGELGYEPRVGFEEGVRRQWEWAQATTEALRH